MARKSVNTQLASVNTVVSHRPLVMAPRVVPLGVPGTRSAGAESAWSQLFQTAATGFQRAMPEK